MPCARPCVKPSLCLFLSNPPNDFRKLVFYSYLKDKDQMQPRKQNGDVHAPSSLDPTALSFILPVLHEPSEV